ncbi:Serine/threonine-protein phosphatase PP1 isozyme 1 [Tritrichomonas foetus]|uniref:Serine/threonine-protein phosphatase n=1 Tax=Tritrichomonas foetus TaxID=1144522 RepID=A0A1J4KL26_9EUKA|nr:Serine/threonine-protein phosphatase PP1 isozyme 1 [Tritrichomonas foetus]|eukprot:OHT12009.1 Serine/threonine-protein phosphatase PP1 isozyme 1 [Tritrichomonas foetus]
MLSVTRSIFLSFKALMLKDCENIALMMKTLGVPTFDQSTISDLCKITISTLSQYPTLLKIEGPVIVVGDIHGSLIDLLRIFGTYGFPPETKYIFLGDYVDRGEFSIDVLVLLMSAFCTYPESVILLRGNHEFRSVCKNYGFRDEILDGNYNPDMFDLFNDVFAYMSLAAVVNNSIFCVHGGLSPKLNDLSDIERINKPILDFSNPLVEDLVWSDPSKIGACDFLPSTRRHGCIFGSVAVNSFYEKTGITAIIRGHSFIMEGAEMYPHLNILSVYSSSSYDSQIPNYCAIITIDEESNITPEILEATPKMAKEEVRMNFNPTGVAVKKTSSFSRIPFQPTHRQSSGTIFLPKASPHRHNSSKGSLPSLKFHF